MAFSIVVFVAALAGIASEKLHRTKIALIGAVLVVVSQTISQEQAIEAIDFNTIGLLAGMMLIVRITEGTGVYNYVAIRAGQLSRGKPFAVVALLATTTALLSAFLDNLTTILLMVPITFLLADTLDIEPIPIVIIEIIASNIGGTATLIGDPPNIIIAGATGLSFGEFIENLAPIAVITFIIVTSLLYLVFRRCFQVAEEARERVLRLDANQSIEDRQELRRTVPILLLTILAFFFHKQLHIEPATVAIAGAALMLLLTKQSVEKAFAGIEWSTLFFFIGLFVMVGALDDNGAIGKIADGISDLTGGNRTSQLMGILWGSAIGSGVVDNIPFTATMIPVVKELQGPTLDNAYWWALALGACFGGNATIIAAAANVAAAGMASRAGMPITFMTFLRVGLPATLLSMVLATIYVLVRYV